MPRKEYEQNELVMDANMQKLIAEAQGAFQILKGIVDQIPTVANPSQFTGDEEDDQFIEEIATLNVDGEVEAADFEEDEDMVPAYYGRGNDVADFGYDGGWGGHGGHGGCGCGCKCQCQCIPKPQPQLYPCVCRKCDLLKAKAYTNLVLGLNGLQNAFDLLPVVEGIFDDAIDSLNTAQRLFKKARICSKKFGCQCYCKTRRKPHCKCYR